MLSSDFKSVRKKRWEVDFKRCHRSNSGNMAIETYYKTWSKSLLLSSPSFTSLHHHLKGIPKNTCKVENSVKQCSKPVLRLAFNCIRHHVVGTILTYSRTNGYYSYLPSGNWHQVVDGLGCNFHNPGHPIMVGIVLYWWWNNAVVVIEGSGQQLEK